MEKQVAYSLSRQARCHNCDKQLQKGEIVKLVHDTEDRELLCAKCTGLDALEILPKGDAKTTRLASKYSDVKYTLLQWSELWKTYERVGLLLDKEAIARAKNEIEK